MLFYTKHLSLPHPQHVSNFQQNLGTIQLVCVNICHLHHSSSIKYSPSFCSWSSGRRNADVHVLQTFILLSKFSAKCRHIKNPSFSSQKVTSLCLWTHAIANKKLLSKPRWEDSGLWTMPQKGLQTGDSTIALISFPILLRSTSFCEEQCCIKTHDLKPIRVWGKPWFI